MTDIYYENVRQNKYKVKAGNNVVLHMRGNLIPCTVVRNHSCLGPICPMYDELSLINIRGKLMLSCVLTLPEGLCLKSMEEDLV